MLNKLLNNTSRIVIYSFAFYVTLSILSTLCITVYGKENNNDVSNNRNSQNTFLESVKMGVKKGVIEPVLVMLYMGADVREKDEQGRNALHYASAGGSLFLVQNFLSESIKQNDEKYSNHIIALKDYVNEKDNNGASALAAAAVQGCTGIVQLLLANGADVDIKGKDGSTPLILASVMGRVCVVKALLENKAKQNIANNTGLRAIDYAIQYKHAEVIRLLIEASQNKPFTDNLCPGQIQIENVLEKYDKLTDAFENNPNTAVEVGKELYNYIDSNFSIDIGRYVNDCLSLIVQSASRKKYWEDDQLMPAMKTYRKTLEKVLLGNDIIK